MTQPSIIKDVVIVGGGTAGWIAAAALSKLMGERISIRLIESEQIGTVGVGEATIPQIKRLNGILGLDENAFLKATQGTFKLGIEFNNWGQIGDSYLHTFGDVGINLSRLHFHQYWLRSLKAGGCSSLWDYSLHNKAAYAHKFGRMERVGDTSMGGLAYAFHFDAGLYAQLLRKVSETAGVTRTEGLVEQVNLRAGDGFIDSVTLQSGEIVTGDLFIDCTGFRGLLIGEALGVDYQDWSDLLPCNRAVTVPSASTEPLLPYTKSTAHTAGWQWRIPLQHRTGNGHVFCDRYMSEDEATSILMDNLDGQAIAEPRVLRFTTGRREQFWHKNCVSLGLASGFLEPLESTSIHFIQSNVSKLIELFPGRQFNAADRAEYNRQISNEFDLVRDFLILHYKLTQRTDSDFWTYCRDMNIPDSLQAKMDLFAQSGRIFREPHDLFRDSSWVQVMVGQGIMPQDYHPMADNISEADLSEFLENVAMIAEQAAAPLPDHGAFIDRFCKA